MLPEFNSLCVCSFVSISPRERQRSLVSVITLCTNDEESLSRFGDGYWCFNQARLLVRSGKYNSLSVGLLNPLVPDKC